MKLTVSGQYTRYKKSQNHTCFDTNTNILKKRLNGRMEDQNVQYQSFYLKIQLLLNVSLNVLLQYYRLFHTFSIEFSTFYSFSVFYYFFFINRISLRECRFESIIETIETN